MGKEHFIGETTRREKHTFVDGQSGMGKTHALIATTRRGQYTLANGQAAEGYHIDLCCWFCATEVHGFIDDARLVEVTDLKAFLAREEKERREIMDGQPCVPVPKVRIVVSHNCGGENCGVCNDPGLPVAQATPERLAAIVADFMAICERSHTPAK